MATYQAVMRYVGCSAVNVGSDRTFAVATNGVTVIVRTAIVIISAVNTLVAGTEPLSLPITSIISTWSTLITTAVSVHSRTAIIRVTQTRPTFFIPAAKTNATMD